MTEPGLLPPPSHQPEVKPKVPWNLRLGTMDAGRAWLLLAASLLCGITMRVAASAGAATLGTTVWVLVLACATAAVGRIGRRSSLAFLGAAAVLAVFLTLRTSPWLVWIDLPAIACLLLAAVAYAPGGSLWTPLGNVARRLVGASGRALGAPHLAAQAVASAWPAPTAITPARRAALATTGRGAVVAVPLVAIIAALMASADRVFASYLQVPSLHASIGGDLAVTATGGLVFLGLIRVSRTSVAERSPGRRTWAGGEAVLVLAALVLLFATFTASQVRAAIGGDAYVSGRTGLTYPEYARSGFFQLLWASGITLSVLMFARGALRRATGQMRFILTLCSVTLCALNITVVIGSVRRIQLYSEEFGFTMLRLYSATFAVWLAVVFVAIAVAALRPADREWVAMALLTLALVGIVGMNVANPEAIVAKRNLDRASEGGALDVEHLSTLSADSYGALAAGLGRLPQPERSAAAAELCRRWTRGSSPVTDGWAYNRAARTGHDTMLALCS